MTDTFELGNVSREKNEIGETVFYVTSPERGNSNIHLETFQHATILDFTKERVLISLSSGLECYVKAWHLFSVDYFDSVTKEICVKGSDQKLNIIPQSTQVRRGKSGSYFVQAMATNSLGYHTLAEFSGPGKLKKAKEWETSFLSKAR